MSLKLSELKTLHSQGFELLYLRPREKRPFENSWAKAPKKSWDELENSFEKSYNVGVRLGEPSRLKNGNYLGAIDCDVKDTSRRARVEMNEALRKLGLDLKTVPTVMSGRGNGSKHIYVQTKTPMRALKYAQSDRKVKVLMPGEKRAHSKTELEKLNADEIKAGYRIRPAWEIGFMGSGQQTVLPPSVHPDTGFEYAWGSPFISKALPLFKSADFVGDTRSAPQISDRNRTAGFEAEEVDLYETRLPLRFIKMIVDGEGVEDRSAELLSMTMSMCRHGFTDNQILSVLSEPGNFISEAAYEHTQSRSREKAVRWLDRYTLQKARFETDIMRRFENKPKLERLSKKDQAIQTQSIAREGEDSLPDLDGHGKPKASLRNLVHLLKNRLGGKIVGFNEFAQRPYFLKDTEYGGKEGQEISGTDDLALKHYVACHYRFEPGKELCYEAHTFLAHENRYHPIREYLSGLVWDEVPRLDSWLISAFRATGPETYLHAVGRKTLVAAVARVFEPGCKFDYMAVLEGNQGEGKSMSLGMLVGSQWFTDKLGDIHNKDVVDQMIGKWLIEVSELDSIRGREVEAVKSFISRQVDRVRLSYERRSQDYPRQCIFIGSTNDSEYLTDPTGNRRYWPVKVRGEADRKWLKENRDQLWAEAVVRYQLGEELYLPKDIELIARKEQEKRFEVDEWEYEIKKIVDQNPVGPFITTELWRAINISQGAGHPAFTDQRRIGRIMQRLGYMRTMRRLEGIRTRCWIKNNNV